MPVLAAGPLIITVAILAAVIAMHTLAHAIRLLGRRNVSPDHLRRSLHADRVHPRHVALGLGESQPTSVVGMGALVASSPQWFFLRIALWRSGHSSERLG